MDGNRCCLCGGVGPFRESRCFLLVIVRSVGFTDDVLDIHTELPAIRGPLRPFSAWTSIALTQNATELWMER